MVLAMRSICFLPRSSPRPVISGHKAGITLSVNDLEGHFLAGGNVNRVVNALISADKAGIALTYKRATAIDLAGRDVFEAEAQIPLAMADAFRNGNFGVLDYQKYRNIQADTAMRQTIAGQGDAGAGQTGG